MIITHRRDKYDNKGLQKEFDIMVKKSTAFDVEVSFPAGLVTLSKQESTGELGFGRLSTISMAMIAQFIPSPSPRKLLNTDLLKLERDFLLLTRFNFSDNVTTAI